MEDLNKPNTRKSGDKKSVRSKSSKTSSVTRSSSNKKVTKPKPSIIVPYSIFYEKKQKSKLSPIQEGTLLLTPETIKVLDNNGEFILEKQNDDKVAYFSEEETITIGSYEIEIIKQLSNSEYSPNRGYHNTKIPETAILDPIKASKTIPQGSLILDESQKIFIEPQYAKKLRPHQVEGVKFMFNCINGNKLSGFNGCILADSMGLGKTLTTLSLIYALTHKNPPSSGFIKKAVIVCPATLLEN